MKTVLINPAVYDCPELSEAGPVAFGVWIAAVCFMSRHRRPTPAGYLGARFGHYWKSAVDALISTGAIVEAPAGYEPVSFDVLGKPAFKFPSEEWSRGAYGVVYARDGRRCRYCATETGPLAIDHVHPRSRGGGDSEGNLVVACRRCNSRKGARTPEEAGMVLLPVPESPR